MHCRVSGRKQAQEGESLEVQKGICEGIALSRGWKLAHEPWLESFSGRKNQRPIFQEILEFIDKNPGKVQYYVFRSIDRFTRGGIYAYEQMKRELMKRGVEMIDSFGIIQPMRNTLEDVGFEYDWSKYSPSEVSEVVLATTAKTEVTTILTRMIGQEIKLAQRGYKVRPPQDGYINQKVFVDGKKRTIQIANPERAKYYIAMFEMRAAGQYTDKEIVERVNAMGYRTKLQNQWSKSNPPEIIGQKGGHLLTVKKLQYHIRKPIYCGIVVEKWTKYKPIQAPYKGLVSIETFNAANRGKTYIRKTGDALDIFYNNHPERMVHKRMRDNPLFPYKFILCPECGKPFLGSSPRGKSGKGFPTYHCARKHRYIGINKKTFDSTVEAFIKSLSFQPEILTSLHAVLLDRYRERQGEIMQIASEVSHNVAELEAQKAQSVKAFIVAADNPIVRTAIESEIEVLDQQMRAAQTERNKMEVTERDIDDFIREAKAIMEQPAKMLLNPTNMQQQQALFGLVFEEIPTYSEILNGTPRLTWIFKLTSGFPKGFPKGKSQVVDPAGLGPATPAPEQTRCGACLLTVPRTKILWTDGDSNPRPPHCKCGALPIELSAHSHTKFLVRGCK